MADKPDTTDETKQSELKGSSKPKATAEKALSKSDNTKDSKPPVTTNPPLYDDLAPDFPEEPPEYLYQDLNLGYEDQPDQSIPEPLPEPPQREEPVLKTDEEKISKEEKSEKWESFVKFVEESADKSLVSLMRNSVLLEISDKSLTIGLQNTRLFTEEKRTQIEVCAQAFFQKEFTIRYKDSLDGLDDSVREKIEQERIKAEEETKKKAAESSNVQEILALFPNSKIKNIEILKEKKHVQRS